MSSNISKVTRPREEERKTQARNVRIAPPSHVQVSGRMPASVHGSRLRGLWTLPPDPGSSGSVGNTTEHAQCCHGNPITLEIINIFFE